MQPFHHDLRCPAAQDNSITHAAAAPSNLDAAATMRSAQTQLLNAIDFFQFRTVEDVETKLSFETSFKFQMFKT